MKWQSIWSLLTIFAICVISVGILSCGTDDDDDTGNKTTTTDPSEEIIVATAEPIDFEAEKREIQEVYRAFYTAFNDKKSSDIDNLWKNHVVHAQFAVVWEAGGKPEPVGPIQGWNDIKANIENLWTARGTSGHRWSPGQPNQFWIRRKRSDPNSLEASARASGSYRTDQGSGITFAYFVKDEHEDWKLQQIESITGNIINNHKIRDPKISKYFTDPSAKAP